MTAFLLMIIYLAFISLGLPDSLLGSGWPVMQQAFAVPISYAGIVTMIVSAGTVCSSLLSDRLTRRLGAHTVTAASVLMTAAALFGFSTASSFWMLCLWAVPYGLGAGAVDAALNNYVALHYSSRHMSWLHCFWGVGTIASPYIMSRALASAGWQSGYRAVSAVQLVIGLAVLFSRPLWKGPEKAAEGRAGKPLGLVSALRIRGVPQLLLGFFSYCAAESTVMLWASSYLVRTRGSSETRAAAFAAFFFIGITAGRFLSGLISDRLGDRALIRTGTGVIAAGILCLLLPIPGEGAALLALLLLGLGCAPIYPSIIHSTPGSFGAENSQAIIGIQMASAYIGSTLMPPVFGLLANHIGLWLMPVYLAAFFLLMIVMTEWSARAASRRSESLFV